ncbi:MAG: 3'(2'),5'-bisphosphate nucleotidase CysQ [Candidatus Latescibacteria bacterium]|nr:3'(2'),5'-bisphosphate nucleotidase CysQ [Candidatus Latescibacterota bacterium]
MSNLHLHDLLYQSKAIALKAGKAILRISEKDAGMEVKEDGSPVTRADIASHNVIVSGLKNIKPEFPVISEEDSQERTQRTSSQRVNIPLIYWLIDPLDGTKEFLKENGEYTVNIALIEKGVPVIGVIYAPEIDILYYAAMDLGSWKIAENSSPVRLKGQGSTNPVTTVVSRSHPSPETDSYLSRFTVNRRIERGSSLKLCAVAEGEADIYPRLNPTSLWDTAAGAVIAREAGCKVKDIEGNELMYDIGNGILQKGFVVYSPKTCEIMPLNK